MGLVLDEAALAALRRDYEADAEPLAAIAARFSISPARLRKVARDMGFAQRPPSRPFARKGPKLAPAAAPAPPPVDPPAPVRKPAPLKPLDLGRMAERVQGAVERELGRIQDQLEAGQDVERHARTLASLVKTLGDLARLEDARAAGKPQQGEGAWDIEELRTEIARRLDRMSPGEPA